MIIKNGRVFQEDGTFAEKDLYIEGKRFVSTKEEVINQEVIDAKGMMVLPGLVDVHSHGAAGHDFSDGDVEGLKEILRYEKAHGITSYCPTSMTLPKDDLLKIFGTIEAIKDEPEAEVIAGVTWKDRSSIRSKKAHRQRRTSWLRTLSSSAHAMRRAAEKSVS